ncbi:hypothetical protein FPV67DRAFT_1457290 [Lyophyllum atratum]|nr:hypothetical protein FPV67DRAFT_1457290 [Lyophyllum atratum]
MDWTTHALSIGRVLKRRHGEAMRMPYQRMNDVPALHDRSLFSHVLYGVGRRTRTVQFTYAAFRMAETGFLEIYGINYKDVPNAVKGNWIWFGIRWSSAIPATCKGKSENRSGRTKDGNGNQACSLRTGSLWLNGRLANGSDGDHPSDLDEESLLRPRGEFLLRLLLFRTKNENASTTNLLMARRDHALQQRWYGGHEEPPKTYPHPEARSNAYKCAQHQCNSPKRRSSESRRTTVGRHPESLTTTVSGCGRTRELEILTKFIAVTRDENVSGVADIGVQLCAGGRKGPRNSRWMSSALHPNYIMPAPSKIRVELMLFLRTEYMQGRDYHQEWVKYKAKRGGTLVTFILHLDKAPDTISKTTFSENGWKAEVRVPDGTRISVEESLLRAPGVELITTRTAGGIDFRLKLA